MITKKEKGHFGSGCGILRSFLRVEDGRGAILGQKGVKKGSKEV